MEFLRVTLERVGLDDRTFDLGFARRYEALRRSIAEVGVSQPLLMRPRSADNKYQIVCGFGRATVAHDLSFTDVPALVLKPTTTDADCLRLALFDNLPHRQFNPIEGAIILAKLGQQVDRARLLSDCMPLLGLKPSAVLLSRTLALLDLTDRLKLAVAEGRIEEKVGVALASLPANDQRAFASLLERCGPSVSIAREWAETLTDVARRDNQTVAEILALPNVTAVLDARAMTRAERTDTLRRLFHHLRYPTLSAREAQFAEAKAALRLPPSIRLEAAPSFESDEMRLEIRFRNEEELRCAAAALAKWFDDPNLLKRLWPDRADP